MSTKFVFGVHTWDAISLSQEEGPHRSLIIDIRTDHQRNHDRVNHNNQCAPMALSNSSSSSRLRGDSEAYRSFAAPLVPERSCICISLCQKSTENRIVRKNQNKSCMQRCCMHEKQSAEHAQNHHAHAIFISTTTS